MVIQWLGQACFKIQSGELVIVIDPFGKEIGLTPPRFRADIVLVSHAHFDHSNSSSLAGDPFIVTEPGEYETKGVYMRGIKTFHDAQEGRERGLNTAFAIDLEGIKIFHLGDFGESEMRDETVEEAGDVDVLLIPVGGVYTIDGEEAARIVNQIEPRFVIPMHYKIPGLSVKIEGPDAFLKEMGASKLEVSDRFTIKKKDIGDGGKTEVALLKPS